MERIVHAAFPHSQVIDTERLTDGLRNASFRVRLDSRPEFIVLRVYEHHASLCQKELDLIGLLTDSVPVPEVIYAEPRGWDEIPPFILTCNVEGISLQELKPRGDREAFAQASYSAGETLASIGRRAFSKPGWLGPGPGVTRPLLEGRNQMLRFVDACLASPNLQQRMPADVRERTRALMWSLAPQLSHLDAEAFLVHGDFGKRNLLVRNITGRWRVVAVLDWEFAVSGSPLADIGHFLRYEQAIRPSSEPHFSTGYLKAGGILPENWRRLAQLVDLVALCEILTHDQLADATVAELVDLVSSTNDNQNPQA